MTLTPAFRNHNANKAQENGTKKGPTTRNAAKNSGDKENQGPNLEQHNQKAKEQLDGDNKKLTEKEQREQAEKAKLKKFLESLQSKIEARQGVQQAIYGLSANEHNAQKQGAIEKFEHLAGLTPEGVAGEVMAAAFFHVLCTLMHVEFISQIFEYSNAQKQGIAYDKDANGKLPPIYKIEKGKVMSDKPLAEKDITRAMIRANGYIPKPSYIESLAVHVAQFRLDMVGSSKLSNMDRELLHRQVKRVEEDASKRDEASDTLAQRLMMQKMQQQAARKAAKP